MGTKADFWYTRSNEKQNSSHGALLLTKYYHRHRLGPHLARHLVPIGLRRFTNLSGPACLFCIRWNYSRSSYFVFARQGSEGDRKVVKLRQLTQALRKNPSRALNLNKESAMDAGP